MKKTLLTIALITFSSHARKGPDHKTLRALSMGNAFVAVAEDKDAIYFNPAGLNLMNKVGNYDVRPDLGYYPENWLDMNLDLGFILPDVLGMARKSFDFYDDHKGTFENMNDDVVAALSADSSLYNDALFLDGFPIPIGAMVSGEFAFHNFGGAFWNDLSVTPFIDAGIVVPSAGLVEATFNAVGQLAGAFEITPQINIGAGYRLIWAKKIERKEVHIANYETIKDTITAELQELEKEILDFSHAFDFGMM